jgi:hypothetical protein
LNTNLDTNANLNSRTTTIKELSVKDKINRLTSVQDKIFAIVGLKAAVDKLKSLKYEVVVQPDGGCTHVKVELKVDFDFDTGLIGGRNPIDILNELESQIKELEGKK